MTNSTSRGRNGRNASIGAAAAGVAVGVAPAVAGAAPPAADGATPPDTAATAFLQLADSLASFFSRHCNAGAPPVGTPAQTFG